MLLQLTSGPWVSLMKQKWYTISSLTANIAQQQWICVGTVVDAVGSSGKKVEYLGKSYDYVFDVDIEDGAPPLKLPYNLSQNPYEAATKFLGDNELPLSYLDNVANFIVQNTQGATLGQDSAPAPGDFGTGRYQPGDASSAPQEPTLRILPLENYLTLATAKFDPVVKKILSINSTMISGGRKHDALNPTEEVALRRMTESLGKYIAAVPATVPGTAATATSQTLDVSEPDWMLLLKLVSQWPDNDRLPGLDLLRCLATSSNVAGLTDASGKSIIEVALQAAFHPSQGSTISENCAMMAFRVIANLFVTEAGRQVAFTQAEKVVDYMESLTGLADTAFKGPVGFPSNRNVLMAVTTAAVNYAVLGYLVSKKKVTIGEGTLTPEVFGLMANVLCRIIKDQTDSEATYRALAALGTMAAAGFGDVMKSFGADETVRAAKADKSAEERIRAIAGEALVLLK